MLPRLARNFSSHRSTLIPGGRLVLRCTERDHSHNRAPETNFDHPESRIDFKIVAVPDLLFSRSTRRRDMVESSRVFVRSGPARRTLHPHPARSAPECGLDHPGVEIVPRPVSLECDSRFRVAVHRVVRKGSIEMERAFLHRCATCAEHIGSSCMVDRQPLFCALAHALSGVHSFLFVSCSGWFRFPSPF